MLINKLLNLFFCLNPIVFPISSVTIIKSQDNSHSENDVETIINNDDLENSLVYFYNDLKNTCNILYAKSLNNITGNLILSASSDIGKPFLANKNYFLVDMAPYEKQTKLYFYGKSNEIIYLKLSDNQIAFINSLNNADSSINEVGFNLDPLRNNVYTIVNTEITPTWYGKQQSIYLTSLNNVIIPLNLKSSISNHSCNFFGNINSKIIGYPKKRLIENHHFIQSFIDLDNHSFNNNLKQLTILNEAYKTYQFLADFKIENTKNNIWTNENIALNEVNNNLNNLSNFKFNNLNDLRTLTQKYSKNINYCIDGNYSKNAMKLKENLIDTQLIDNKFTFALSNINDLYNTFCLYLLSNDIYVINEKNEKALFWSHEQYFSSLDKQLWNSKTIKKIEIDYVANSNISQLFNYNQLLVC